MEARKLTEEEIDRLFDFCTKHYVPQYDLQIELVDHLASGIEDQWTENPDLPFQVALNNTFEQFGIFGFSKIKSQKENELRRKYRRMLFHYVADFYKWPKILLTFALSFFLFVIFQITNNVQAVTISISAVVCVFLIAYHVYFFEKFFGIKPQPGKQFLIVNYLKSRIFSVSVAYQSTWFICKLVSKTNSSHHAELLFVFAVFLVSLTILIYVYFLVIPRKIKEYFTQQFPQFIQS